jgi:hypothetical protein
MDIELVEPAQTQAVTQSTPGGLIALAIQRGTDIAQLEKLLELQQRWEANEARKAYHAAFSAFKSEGVRVLRNRRVDAGPLQGKSYAELHAVVDAVTEALSRHGLSASWKTTKDEKDWLEVTCTLSHVGGHSESVSMGGPPDAGGAKNAIQARGSTITYLQRYTLKAITGLAEAGQDDDGQGGKGRDDAGPDETLLTAGRDAAMQGMKALTAWWGGLTGKQRSTMNKEFAGLRRAAQGVDRG